MSFIILDRDGVINYDSTEYIKNPDEWIPIPGSLEAIAQLNRAGFRVVVATNQSGVGRGYYDIDMLDRIHEKMMHELAAVGGHVEEIFFCPHLPDDGCDCRKPKPGLIYQIKTKYDIKLNQTFFIGDSHVDIQAAKTAGCNPILILSYKGMQTLKQYPELAAIPNFQDLASAVDYILSARNERE